MSRRETVSREGQGLVCLARDMAYGVLRLCGRHPGQKGAKGETSTLLSESIQRDAVVGSWGVWKRPRQPYYSAGQFERQHGGCVAARAKKSEDAPDRQASRDDGSLEIFVSGCWRLPKRVAKIQLVHEITYKCGSGADSTRSRRWKGPPICVTVGQKEGLHEGLGALETSLSAPSRSWDLVTNRCR